jgi:heat shock protein beta
MDMIVNSLYSNKETFLRELISNASDALDKVRFISIERPEILLGKQALEIRIKSDSSSNTLIIEDDGIGMTREDLHKNLGTIASSGTVKFVDALKEKQKKGDTNQIGKFGVGFYSAFLVAKAVKVQTRHPDGDGQWVWESTLGSQQYRVYKDTSEEIVRGTRVSIDLNGDSLEFLDTVRLRGLIKLYSEFVAFPINLWLADDVDKRVVDEEMTKKTSRF